MVQAGCPLAEVREILGHATMQTTLGYAHLKPEHLRASISALDRVSDCHESGNPPPALIDGSAKLLKTNTRL